MLREIVFTFTYDDFQSIADYVLSMHFLSARTDINKTMNRLQTGSIAQCRPETKTKLNYCNVRVADCVWQSGKHENSIMAFTIYRNALIVFHDLVCVNVITLLDPEIGKALL